MDFSKSGKVWIVVLIIIFVILVGMFVTGVIIYNSITDLKYANMLKSTESNEIYKPVAKAVILGKEQTITDDEINGIITKTINGTKQSSSSDFVIKGVTLYTQQDGSVKFYVDLYYKGDRRFIFSGDADVKLDDSSKKLNLIIKSTTLGTLSLPPSLVMSKVSPSINKLGSGISADGCNITVPAEFTIEILKKDITVNLKELSIKEGSITIKTNSAGEIVKEALKSAISDKVDGLLSDEIVSTVVDFIMNNQLTEDFVNQIIDGNVVENIINDLKNGKYSNILGNSIGSIVDNFNDSEDNGDFWGNMINGVGQGLSNIWNNASNFLGNIVGGN